MAAPARVHRYQEEISKLKALLSGQVDIGSLNDAGSPKKEEPRRRSIGGNDASDPEAVAAKEAQIRAELEEEKQQEIREIEARMQSEYDSKLSDLEAQFNQTGVDHDVLEKQFAELTEDYEAKRAVVESGVVVSEEQVQQAMTEAGMDKGAVAASGGGAANAAQAPRTKPAGRAATVIGADGTPVIALHMEDGSYIKATLGEDGQLRQVPLR